jgi:hypothetical protein
MLEESKAYYAGIEPVEIGNLDEIKEERQYIPATRNVRLKIKKAEIRVNQENTYRQISLQLQLTQGIGEEGKYKNKVIFTRICYYADPTIYVNDFFVKRQHLVMLKQLAKATGVDLSMVDGHTPELLEQAPEIIANIIVTKRQAVVEGQPIVDENGNPVYNFDNEARQFQALPLEEQI